MTGTTSLSLGQAEVFSLIYTVEAQFVPGTSPVCPWDKLGLKTSRKSLCVKSLCAFFTPNFEKTLGIFRFLELFRAKLLQALRMSELLHAEVPADVQLFHATILGNIQNFEPFHEMFGNFRLGLINGKKRLNILGLRARQRLSDFELIPVKYGLHTCEIPDDTPRKLD